MEQDAFEAQAVGPAPLGRRAVIATAGLGAVAALAIIARVLGPGALRHLPACPLHEWTGLYCPGCGTTRAIYHLLRGECVAACSANLLAVVAIALGAIAWVARPWLAPRLARWSARSRGIALIAAALIVIAFGVLRNLSGTPFAWLAP
ncbi:MAG TPA: DUF2752 domain-containing protein [Terriglobales bacterium]|nr:DUF2752 domain-containing protein [Terriglobales bacterium]